MTKRGETVLITGAIGLAALALIVKDYLTTPYDDTLESVGKAWGVSPSLLKAIARQESGFRASLVVNEPNGTHSYGLFMINDSVATTYGLDVSTLTDPRVSANTAARLLSDIRTALVRADRFSVQAWIDSYREGVSGFLKTGVNTAKDIAYTGAVWSNYFLYSLAATLRNI